MGAQDILWGIAPSGRRNENIPRNRCGSYTVMEDCKNEGESFLQSFLSGMFTVSEDGCIDFTKSYNKLLNHNYQL